MELSWLYSIPRTVFLDRFFLFFTQLPGAIGQLWLIVGIVLLFFKRTRKTGAAILVSYIGVLLFGELLLKHVVTRMRPCQIDQTFAMLVERPTSSSFPSTLRICLRDSDGNLHESPKGWRVNVHCRYARCV